MGGIDVLRQTGRRVWGSGVAGLWWCTRAARLLESRRQLVSGCRFCRTCGLAGLLTSGRAAVVEGFLTMECGGIKCRTVSRVVGVKNERGAMI